MDRLHNMESQSVAAGISGPLDVTDLALECEPSVDHALYSWNGTVANFAHCLIDANKLRLGRDEERINRPWAVFRHPANDSTH